MHYFLRIIPMSSIMLELSEFENLVLHLLCLVIPGGFES